MGTYLGTITIRNRYVNFKPFYIYSNNELHILTSYERQALLPESQKEDINLYYEDSRKDAEDDFFDGQYCLLTFDFEDLEDNYSYGSRNQTGYKIDLSKLDSEKLIYLDQIDRFYLLSDYSYDGDYHTNPTLIVTDPYAYDGLGVVIESGEPDTVLGPFEVEWRESDGNLVIRTKLNTQKYILHGYHFPSPMEDFEIQLGRYGDQKTFVHLDRTHCEETSIDVITDEQLLNSFKNTLNEETFTDGKLDLDNIPELLKGYEESLFIGDLPREIAKERFDRVTSLLTDEERLNDTFGFISETITGLLVKYQDNEQYRKLIQTLAEDKEFMSRIQRFSIITDRIDLKQQELDELSREVDRVRQAAEDERHSELAENLIGDYEDTIAELRDQKNELDADIAKKTEQLEDINEAVSLKEKLEYLNNQVTYKQQRSTELNQELNALSNKIDSVFENATEKAVDFAFDGMLSSRMLQQAAEWGNSQNSVNYGKKVEDYEKLTLILESKEPLIDRLVNRIQMDRPNYDKNTILNILICYTQGFLTVFSGEPGTGKTSICKILASALGLDAPKYAIPPYTDGYDASRFVPVSVERGWTTKRDFIGYYNPLTKEFDRSNRRIFDALNILDTEAHHPINMPYMILLDEANLSPMEYYWADFMKVCDEIDGNSSINLGADFQYRIPSNLRFVATINNDHTTEALSPRLVDRAWIIRLPKVRSGMSRLIGTDSTSDEIVAWSAMESTFGATGDDLTGAAKTIYDELVLKCKSSKISVSGRADRAIRQYWSTAQRLFDNDTNYGTDASIVALDYAVAQRILPHIDGSGKEFGEKLADLQQFFSDRNLSMSADFVSEIIQTGENSMQYYQFFA